jgi:hypothetical protein
MEWFISNQLHWRHIMWNWHARWISTIKCKQTKHSCWGARALELRGTELSARSQRCAGNTHELEDCLVSDIDNQHCPRWSRSPRHEAQHARKWYSLAIMEVLVRQDWGSAWGTPCGTYGRGLHLLTGPVPTNLVKISRPGRSLLKEREAPRIPTTSATMWRASSHKGEQITCKCAEWSRGS